MAKIVDRANNNGTQKKSASAEPHAKLQCGKWKRN